MEAKKMKIRPYARLLTMLGEQLIKNEQIALAELIKNSYDADADWVKVCFTNIKGKEQKEQTLIIEDNGCGMSLSTIQNSWMNPATPYKKSNDGVVRKTASGRVVQGEKGIGRFAILKLGRKITITTRPQNTESEYVISYDFSIYDRDFLTERGESKELFLDDIVIDVIERRPEVFISRTQVINGQKFSGNLTGTRIEISCLNSQWTEEKVNEVNKESQKLESIFDRLLDREKRQRKIFNIAFIVDGSELFFSDETVKRLEYLLRESTVLRITNGKYSESKKEFTYDENDVHKTVSLTDPKLIGLKVFKDYFIEKKQDQIEIRQTSCGDFGFNFYIFDLSAGKNSKYFLDKTDKEIVKEHRIYLYRDGIRVVPYGDPDNDWLETDKKRATGRTGDYLSNDQIVGFVDISKEKNPNLKDKTNREGLIEEGSSSKDFVNLLHVFLLYIRKNPYQRYQQLVLQRKLQIEKHNDKIKGDFEELKSQIQDNPQALATFKKLFRSYKKAERVNKRKLELTEDLAGVGLSVETASHDLMLMLVNGLSKLDMLIHKNTIETLSREYLFTELSSIRGLFSFVRDQMKNLQLLFRSSRQRKHPIRVEDVLKKVCQIYAHTLASRNITCTIEKHGSPITVSTTDAVLLQVFINLFDNAIYWIDTIDQDERMIQILLDGDSKRVVFADTGPGIQQDDQLFIFEAFYSGKEDGRGLGLYIAQQLLTRSDFSISLITKHSDKLLSGANFEIDFGEKNE